VFLLGQPLSTPFVPRDLAVQRDGAGIQNLLAIFKEGL
jgi:hypothetical protein